MRKKRILALTSENHRLIRKVWTRASGYVITWSASEEETEGVIRSLTVTTVASNLDEAVVTGCSSFDVTRVALSVKQATSCGEKVKTNPQLFLRPLATGACGRSGGCVESLENRGTVSH